MTIRATIHRSGKLGFSRDAEKVMGLSPERGVLIFVDDETIGDLYLQIVEMPNEDAYTLSVGGGYYFARTTDFFDLIGVDYADGQTRYSVRMVEIDGEKMYRLQRRATKKAKEPKKEMEMGNQRERFLDIK